MKYILLVLLCCALSIAHAQNDAKSKAFINEVMANKSVKLYKEFIDPALIKSMATVFNYPKLEGMGYGRKTPDSLTLVLTDYEKAYLKKEFINMPDHKWTDGLLDSAKVLPYQSAPPENIRIDDFTKPVFIRNNTLCFFYDASSLHVSGRGYIAGKLAVYKKINNKWVKWITVFSIMS